ncbi:unnamed protein product [Urochloa humidicola]
MVPPPAPCTGARGEDRVHQLPMGRAPRATPAILTGRATHVPHGHSVHAQLQPYRWVTSPSASITIEAMPGQLPDLEMLV